MQQDSQNSRLPAFVGGVTDPAAALRAAAVAVVGVGSVGLAGVLHLARAGLGRLQLFDRGSLKAASVRTHPVQPSDIGAATGGAGSAKVDHAWRAIDAIAPDTAVEVFAGDFAAHPLDAIDADVVLLAVDNLGTELDVAQRALHLGIPLVQAAVYGPTLGAVVRTFTGGVDGDGPCLTCLFDRNEWRQVSREAQFSCDGASDRRRALAPTQSTSSLCSLAAELAVHRILRHLLGLGEPLADQLLEYHGYLDRMVTTVPRRNPGCRLEHRRFEIRERAAARTVAEAVARSGLAAAHTIAVDGTTFVGEVACGSGRWHALGRFVTGRETLGPCDCCGGPLEPSPFDQSTAVAVAGRAGLVLPPHRPVLVRDRADRAVLLCDARRTRA